MKKQILVTDTLFIGDDHVKQLARHGFIVERLAKPNASEAELCEAIRGKQGYILGGIERITLPVIAAADQLEAIAFTGSGYTEFIPAHQEATEKGIAITAAKGVNAQSVAEYTLMLILVMVRQLPLLTTPGEAGGLDFYIAHELGGLTLGVIGYGHVGSRVASLARTLGMRVLVASRKPPSDIVNGIRFVPLNTLLSESDVITIHVNRQNGTGVIGSAELDMIKSPGILINTAFPQAVDTKALHGKLMGGTLRSAFDMPPDDFAGVPLGSYLTSNAQTAFNTYEANERMNERVVASIINLLTRGDDIDVINPEFKQYRK